MTETQNEQKAPTKEEVITFLTEQIEVKKVQLQLQVLNAELAEARMREVKALGFIGQMTNPQPPSDSIPHNLTQEDLDENPDLVEAGLKVGDEVLIPKESKPRSLKKK